LSDSNETFTERVDVSRQPDGPFIGALEIDVPEGDPHQEQMQALRDECDRLRDRVAQLERSTPSTPPALAGVIG
jgi:hypothetical protein